MIATTILILLPLLPANARSDERALVFYEVLSAGEAEVEGSGLMVIEAFEARILRSLI